MLMCFSFKTASLFCMLVFFVVRRIFIETFRWSEMLDFYLLSPDVVAKALLKIEDMSSES